MIGDIIIDHRRESCRTDFSIIPSILIFILLKKRNPENELYKKSCNSSLIRGFVAVLPIIALSAVLFILNVVLKMSLLQNVNNLVYTAIYTFIVLALAEELVKYIAFRLLLKKKLYSYTWADVVAFMVIIGTAFGLIEDLPYAIGASPMQIIVRGVTMGHVGYGFIMGWFYGKKLYTGKKIWGVIAFLLPWLMHGIYDFSLTPELIALNDNLVFIALTIALIDIVLLILMIRFFVRANKHKKACYDEPLVSSATVTESE